LSCARGGPAGAWEKKRIRRDRRRMRGADSLLVATSSPDRQDQ
jgi:hypothetical protein